MGSGGGLTVADASPSPADVQRSVDASTSSSDTRGEIDTEVGTVRFELIRKIDVDPSGVLGSVDGVAFSADGQWLAAGDLHAEARLYKVSDGSFVRKVTHHPGLFGKAGELNALGFSPDGRWFFTGIDGFGCKVWRVDDGSLVKHLENGKTTDGADISSDGKHLAMGAGNAIAIYQLSDFSKLKQIAHATGTQEVNSLHFSRDGKWLASGAGDGRIKLIATDTWQEARTIQVGQSVKSVRLSPDGALVAMGARGKLSGVYAVDDGRSVKALVHTGNSKPLPGDDDDTNPAIEAVAWTDDGRYLYTSGVTDGVLHVWRRSDWKLVAQVQAQEKNRGIEYIAAHGDLVAVGGDEGRAYLFRATLP
jgi:WD40 repeat protein